MTTIAMETPARGGFVALVVSAVRGIGWRHVRAAMLLGLAITAWEWLVSAFPIMKAMRTMPFALPLLGALIAHQLRALCLMVAVVIADRAVDEGAPRRRTYVLATLLGCLAGSLVSAPVDWAWHNYVLPDRYPAKWAWAHGTAALFFWPLYFLMLWLLAGGGVVFLYADRRAARKTAQLLQAAELERIRRSRLAFESRLQAMQARVEPQFLFNTLAQVERLFGLDPRLGAQMMDDLIAYLRAAMPLMRDTSSTVAQEIELARAYLDIVRLRVGERLTVHIQSPAEAASMRMPPMMLLPLIDHAVVRGLEPSTAAGTISVQAAVDANRLHVTITDSGAGFVPGSPEDGLAAIRERLETLYGDAATLDLRQLGGGATAAVFDLPAELDSHPRPDLKSS